MGNPIRQRVHTKLNDLRAHVAKDGLRFFLSAKIFDLFIRTRFSLYGIKNLKAMGQEANQHSLNNDAHLNWPSSFYELKQGIARLPIPASEITLLDYGCGNGNVLLYGMYKNFKKVVGIDLDQQALRSAELHCRQMAARKAATACQVIEAEAATFEIPEEINVIYLFNPFGECTTKAVAENIFGHVKKHNKILFVIYFLPSYRQFFEAENKCVKLYERLNRAGTSSELAVYRVG